MSDHVATLRDARNAFDRARSGYQIRLRHLLPDTVLYNLLLDIAEHTHAIDLLVTSDVPRAAMVNARAAFECCLDALLLTADSSLYDERGMYARACELVEQENLLERMNAADAALGNARHRNAASPEEVIAAESEFWSEELPGARNQLQAVLEEVRATGRWKRHWSGLGGIKHVVNELDRLEGPGKGLKEMADALYALQSIHAHPRPRTGMRHATYDHEGRIAVTPFEEDGQRAASIAVLACSLATLALERRP